jgi:hypothetical protein
MDDDNDQLSLNTNTTLIQPHAQPNSLLKHQPAYSESEDDNLSIWKLVRSNYKEHRSRRHSSTSKEHRSRHHSSSHKEHRSRRHSSSSCNKSSKGTNSKKGNRRQHSSGCVQDSKQMQAL